MSELRNDLKEIRGLCREYVNSINKSNLEIIDRKSKVIALWIGAINTEARLNQTVIKGKEQDRLIDRFTDK